MAWVFFFVLSTDRNAAVRGFSGRLDLAVGGLRSLEAKKRAISEFVSPPLPLALLMFLQA